MRTTFHVRSTEGLPLPDPTKTLLSITHCEDHFTGTVTVDYWYMDNHLPTRLSHVAYLNLRQTLEKLFGLRLREYDQARAKYLHSQGVRVDPVVHPLGPTVLPAPEQPASANDQHGRAPSAALATFPPGPEPAANDHGYGIALY